MMIFKKEKMAVTVGALLLTGVCAIAYTGINAVAFAETSATQEEAIVEVEQVTTGDSYISLEDAIEIGIQSIYEEFEILVNLEDTSIHVYEFQTDEPLPLENESVILLTEDEIKAEDFEIEEDFKDIYMHFFASDYTYFEDGDRIKADAMWNGSFGSFGEFGEYNFGFWINAITGEVISIVDHSVSPTEFLLEIALDTMQVTVSTFDGDVDVEETEVLAKLQSYHLSVEDVIALVEGVVDEAFGVSLDGLYLRLIFMDNPHENFAIWSGFVLSELTNGAEMYAFAFDARTGELLSIEDVTDYTEAGAPVE